MNMSDFSGTIAGYDPGGNHCHGLALLEFKDGACKSFNVDTLETAEEVILELQMLRGLNAIGIDTLAAWATGLSGWRPADHWLRNKYKNEDVNKYPSVLPSVVSPNGLYGSMSVNGMSVLIKARETFPLVQITETHPKVLYYALTKKKYAYDEESHDMDNMLSHHLGLEVATKNDHEWDAMVSALAAYSGISGAWTHDLFHEHSDGLYRMIYPAGEASYYWPE
jgi:hypothetical protein